MLEWTICCLTHSPPALSAWFLIVGLYRLLNSRTWLAGFGGLRCRSLSC